MNLPHHRLVPLRSNVIATIVACCFPWMIAHACPAADFLVASDYFGAMRRVDPNTGAILSTMSGGLDSGEIDFGPDKLIYASHFENSSIQTVNPFTGNSVGTIALPGKPRDVTFGPDGQLYIAVDGDGNGNGVIGIFRYNLATQQLSSQFNTSVLNGAPTGIAFGDANDLFVALDARFSGNGVASIERIDGQTGDLKGVFATTNVSIPQSIAFGSNGDLYVGNQGTGTITYYSPAGSYLGVLTSSAGNPQGLYFLPDGNLEFGRGGNNFAKFDFASNSLNVFSSGYSFAHSTVLVPEPSTLGLAIVGSITFLAAWRRRFARE